MNKSSASAITPASPSRPYVPHSSPAAAPLSGFAPAKTHYPFFVMSMATFMELDGLLPDHQTMLQRGDLIPHDPETMQDDTMFISHQCTSFFPATVWPNVAARAGELWWC